MSPIQPPYDVDMPSSRSDTRSIVTLRHLDDLVRAFKATCGDCDDCALWSAYAHASDTSGCNWSIPADDVRACKPCDRSLSAYVSELRRSHNVAIGWRSE